MGIVININGEATRWTVIVLNGNIIITFTEELDMEETFFHAKFFNDCLTILAQFWIHIFKNIIRIVHLVNHEIKRCMGIVKGRRKDDISISIYQTIKGTDFTRGDKFFKEING